jgi:peptidoglycan/LPS O-acetylase OafA/YrhL
MGSSPRIPELDGLRGLAILAVMLYHYAPQTGALRFLAPVLVTGWIGVDLFFVLSGYLITGILLDSVGRPGYYRNFIVRRALRILPAYYACLFLCGMVTYYPAYAFDWKDFLHATGWYFLYFGNVKEFLENQWPRMALLTPLWSLQVEEQFYLFFPLLVWALRRQTLAKALAGAAVAALAIRVALTVAMPSNLLGVYVLTPCRMDALAMGGLIAIAIRERPEWLRKSWIGWGAAFFAAVFAAVWELAGNSPWSVAMRTIGFTAADLAFAGLLATLVGRRPPILLALFRARVLVWLGTISYGVYLLHVMAPKGAHVLLDPLVKLPPQGSADLFLSLGASVCAAWLSWSFFERPILKWKERLTADHS